MSIVLYASELSSLAGLNPYRSQKRAIIDIFYRQLDHESDLSKQLYRYLHKGNKINIDNNNNSYSTIQSLTPSEIEQLIYAIDEWSCPPPPSHHHQPQSETKFKQSIELCESSETKNTSTTTTTTIPTKSNLNITINNMQSIMETTLLNAAERLEFLPDEQIRKKIVALPNAIVKCVNQLDSVRDCYTQQSIVEFIKHKLYKIRGMVAEDKILNRIEQDTNSVILDRNKGLYTLQCEKFTLRGRIDGLRNDGEIIELKLRQSGLLPFIPDHEKVQLHAYMLLLDREQSLWVQSLGKRYRTEVVDFDHEWWFETVIPGIEHGLNKIQHLLDLVETDSDSILPIVQQMIRGSQKRKR